MQPLNFKLKPKLLPVTNFHLSLQVVSRALDT